MNKVYMILLILVFIDLRQGQKRYARGKRFRH